MATEQHQLAWQPVSLLTLEAGQQSESENRNILQLAQELCGQFNLETVSPEKLSWQEEWTNRGRFSQDKYGNPIGQRVTPHYPLLFKGSLILNPVLKGRLGVEEWRSLLVSSVIFYGRLKGKMNRRTALLFAPTLSLLVFFLVNVLLRGFLLSGLLPVLALAGVAIATAVAGAYSSLLVSRRLMLVADRTAAESTGPQSLLEVLRKIQRLRESDEKEDKMAAWAWTEYGDAPSVEKRIQNLEPRSDNQ